MNIQVLEVEERKFIRVVCIEYGEETINQVEINALKEFIGTLQKERKVN